MKSFTVAILLLAIITARGQGKPKPKKVPTYKIVMACSKGQTLYARYNIGIRPINEYVSEVAFAWIKWDGESELLGETFGACFKGIPPPNGDLRGMKP